MFSREALENLCRCHATKKPRIHVQGSQDRVCKTYRLYRIILSTSVPLRGGGLLYKTIGFLAPGVRDPSWFDTGNPPNESQNKSMLLILNGFFLMKRPFTTLLFDGLWISRRFSLETSLSFAVIAVDHTLGAGLPVGSPTKLGCWRGDPLALLFQHVGRYTQISKFYFPGNVTRCLVKIVTFMSCTLETTTIFNKNQQLELQEPHEVLSRTES